MKFLKFLKNVMNFLINEYVSPTVTIFLPIFISWFILIKVVEGWSVIDAILIVIVCFFSAASLKETIRSQVRRALKEDREDRSKKYEEGSGG